MMRKIVSLLLSLLILAAVSGCDLPNRRGSKPSGQVAEPAASDTGASESSPQAATATLTPFNLTPITISGTPVIIPEAIQFTPTPPPTGIFPAQPIVEATTTESPILGDVVKLGQTDDVPAPQIHAFGVSPEGRVSIGQTVTVRWETSANRLSLWITYRTGPAVSPAPGLVEAIPLDAQIGSREVTLRAASDPATTVEFRLIAETGIYDPSTGQLLFTQETQQVIDLPLACPYLDSRDCDQWGTPQ